MRFFTFASVTVAFISTVSAKMGFGACPETVPMKTWYDCFGPSGFRLDRYYHHEILAIDNQLDQLIGQAKKFGLKIPFDVACDDLGTLPPFNRIAKAIFEEAEAEDASQTEADGKNFNYPN